MIRSGKNALVARFAPALLVWLASPTLAAAAPIRYDFGGVATYVGPSSGLPIGTRFEGTLVYDDAIPLGRVERDAAGALTAGSYYSGTHREADPTADGTGLDIRIGGVSVVAPSTGLSGSYKVGSTVSGEPLAHLTFGGQPAADEPGLTGGQVSFALAGASAFGGGLPGGLTLADLTYGTVSVGDALWAEDVMAHPPLFTGVIDSLTATPVPEPAWTVAALLGAAAYFTRRRRGAA